jgi:hypothetical protein
LAKLPFQLRDPLLLFGQPALLRLALQSRQYCRCCRVCRWRWHLAIWLCLPMFRRHTLKGLRAMLLHLFPPLVKELPPYSQTFRQSQDVLTSSHLRYRLTLELRRIPLPSLRLVLFTHRSS